MLDYNVLYLEQSEKNGNKYGEKISLNRKLIASDVGVCYRRI